MAEALEAMTEEQILDFADTCAETARRAEVDLLRAAYQWAVVHSPERLDPARASLPGREKARRYGGAGTPEVTEFAAATFGVRIGRSTFAAQRLIADALDLHHRHPQLWARVQAGEVRASYARHVVKATRDLTAEQAGYVDAGVVESADGRITWSRFEALAPSGAMYLVDHTGTRRLRSTPKSSFLELYRPPVHIDIDPDDWAA